MESLCKRIWAHFNRLFLLTFAIIIYSSCSENNDDLLPVPQADYRYSPDNIEVDMETEFINTSIHSEYITEYLWDFGDESNSNEENPVHTFSSFGIHPVSLTVKNKNGLLTTKTREIPVSLNNKIADRKNLKERLSILEDKILVCAHRAYHIKSPENSIAAIQNAINEKIAFVEIDIRQTMDGELVLLHDKTIDRTTNGTGEISKMTYEQVHQYNLLHNGQLTGQVIPTLKEVFELARGKIYIDLDIKIESYAKVFNLVKLYGMIGQVMFSVNDIMKAKSLVQNDQRVILLPIIKTQNDFDAYTMAGLNLSVLHFSSGSFNENMVDQAKAKNLSVFKLIYVNSSVTPETDDYKQVENFIKLGGSIIQTDYPVRVKKYLEN